MTQAGGQHGHYHPVVVFSGFYDIQSEDAYRERVDTSKHSMNPCSRRKWRGVILLEAFLRTYFRSDLKKKRGKPLTLIMPINSFISDGTFD